MQLKRLDTNARGRDFVVGDLHGERAWLERELAAIGFDVRHDRLFAVGDLIDRGSDSVGTLQLLDEPWFHAVLGNHEAMMIDAEHSDDARFAWLRHGGEWAAELPPRVRLGWIGRLRALPHLLVVGEGQDRFHVVHAELTDRIGMPICDEDLDGPASFKVLRAERMLWSTTLAQRLQRVQSGLLAANPVHPGLSPTFCGHVPVAQPGWHQSHYFLDGGAGYGKRLLHGAPAQLHVLPVASLLQSYLLAAVQQDFAGAAMPLQQAASAAATTEGQPQQGPMQQGASGNSRRD